MGNPPGNFSPGCNPLGFFKLGEVVKDQDGAKGISSFIIEFCNVDQERIGLFAEE